MKLAVLTSIVLLGAAACGGAGQNGSTEVDGYVASFLAAQEQANIGLAYVPTPSFDEDSAITDDERVSLEANYAGNLQVSREFVALLVAITPPGSIQDAHDAFVAALEAQIDYRATFTEQYGDVQTIQELQELTSGVLDNPKGEAKQAALDAACQDLASATESAPTPISCGDE